MTPLPIGSIMVMGRERDVTMVLRPLTAVRPAESTPSVKSILKAAVVMALRFLQNLRA